MSAVLHDFTKPGRLPAEWHHKLAGWFRMALDLTNKAWAKQVSFPMSATLIDMELLYGRLGLSQLAEGKVGYRVLLAGKRAPSFLSLPRATLLRLVAAMLGDTEVTDENREMTSVEESLAEYFLVNYWLPFFKETWPGREAVSWDLQPRETNPQCSRLFADADVLIAWTVQLHGPWGDRHATWFFHKSLLFEALGERDRTVSETIPDAQLAARREAIVTTLPLTVEVVVGTAELKLSQVTQLQVGDVVVLEQRAQDAIVARTLGRELFRGKPGRLGSSKAMRIEAVKPS